MDDNKKHAFSIAVGGKGSMTGKIVTEEFADALHKRGMIVASYPGMGHELFCDVYPNYVHIPANDYTINELDVKAYADAAEAKLKDKDVNIVFVDAHTDIIYELVDRKLNFVIFYPGESIEVKDLKDRCIRIYNTKVVSGKHNAQYLVDYLTELLIFLANKHESKVDELRLFNNSVATATGILNEELIAELAVARPREQKKLLNLFAQMKKGRLE
jgi:hypothetical protein